MRAGRSQFRFTGQPGRPVLILYEYPFNERIRTLLRLEDLFERLDFFLAQEHPLQHHVALTTLFEIVDVAGRADIIKWAQPLVPLRDATLMVLRLLRESGQSGKVIATSGSYQQMLSGRIYQLMQVRLDDGGLPFIPEISANKYMLWVRFTQQDGDQRPKPVDADIPFQLKLCNF